MLARAMPVPAAPRSRLVDTSCCESMAGLVGRGVMVGGAGVEEGGAGFEDFGALPGKGVAEAVGEERGVGVLVSTGL